MAANISIDLTDEQVTKLTEALKSGRSRMLMRRMERFGQPSSTDGLLKESNPDINVLVNNIITGLINEGDRMKTRRATLLAKKSTAPIVPPVITPEVK